MAKQITKEEFTRFLSKLDEELCLKTDADINTVNRILNELYF